MKVFGMKKNEKTDMNIKDADARRRSRLTYFVFLQFLHLWLILRAEKVAIAGRNCPALRKSLSMLGLTSPGKTHKQVCPKSIKTHRSLLNFSGGFTKMYQSLLYFPEAKCTNMDLKISKCVKCANQYKLENESS